MRWSFALLPALALAACDQKPEVPVAPKPVPICCGPGASASASATRPSDLDAALPSSALVRARPYALVRPTGASAGPRPLVVLLHGLGSDGASHDQYLGFSPVTRARGVVLALPDGTRDSEGRRYWNATDACCDAHGAGPDDVAYLDALIDDARARADVDPARVFLVGHSNGGFMAYRYACDRPGRVAAIVSLAGASWKDDAKCAGGKGVSVLQVHGDEDAVIPYRGGKSFLTGAPHPGAEESAAAWAKRDGCTGPAATAGPAADFVPQIVGAETTQVRWVCPAGLGVELWTVHHGPHVPPFAPSWAEAVVTWLLAHPRSG
jgi:polyhydroxybutyrate depolymerase